MTSRRSTRSWRAVARVRECRDERGRTGVRGRPAAFRNAHAQEAAEFAPGCDPARSGLLSSELTVQPAFIVGQRRSGTHMLRRVLNSHPDITMAPELNFAVAFDPAAAQGMEAIYRQLVHNRHYWYLGVGPRFLGDFTAEMRALVEDIGRAQGSRVSGGIVHFNFDRLVTIWPDGRFVRIVRDLRDVYASTRALGLEGNAWSVATGW